jgi:putative sterol carrier protein
MVEILDAQHTTHKKKKGGAIQFFFFHKNQEWICYIKADKNHLEFHVGKADNQKVTLRCDFFHWLDLSSGKLNPVWGMITQRLKFEGKISFFKMLPKPDFNVNISDKDDPPTAFEKNVRKKPKQAQSAIIINASPPFG